MSRCCSPLAQDRQSVRAGGRALSWLGCARWRQGRAGSGHGRRPWQSQAGSEWWVGRVGGRLTRLRGAGAACLLRRLTASRPTARWRWACPSTGTARCARPAGTWCRCAGTGRERKAGQGGLTEPLRRLTPPWEAAAQEGALRRCRSWRSNRSASARAPAPVAGALGVIQTCVPVAPVARASCGRCCRSARRRPWRSWSRTCRACPPSRSCWARGSRPTTSRPGAPP